MTTETHRSGGSYYDLLGVSPDATEREVAEAFERRIVVCHEEASSEAEARAIADCLTRAKEVLLHPVERRRYDRLGHDRYLARRTYATRGDASPEAVLVFDRDRYAVEAGNDLRVAVSDARGDPIEGVTVRLRDGDGRAIDAGATDADGAIAFETDGLRPNERAHLSAEAAGYEAADAPVDVTPNESNPIRRALDLAVPSTATIGEAVPVRVRDDRGRPVADARVTCEGEATGNAETEVVRTDDDGTATLSFDRAGAARVAVAKAEPGYEFEDDSARLVVHKRLRRLTVVPERASVTRGDAVTVVVSDDDGRRIEGVELTASADSGSSTVVGLTNANGTATIELSHSGEVTIAATKSDTRREHFASDTTTVTVEKPTRSVSLRASADRIPAGEPVAFEVTDADGAPLDGISIDFEGATATTEDGVARVPTGSVTGTFTARVDHETSAVRFVADPVTVTVVDPSRTDTRSGATRRSPGERSSGRA